jgi:hypothetical protein
MWLLPPRILCTLAADNKNNEGIILKNCKESTLFTEEIKELPTENSNLKYRIQSQEEYAV